MKAFEQLADYGEIASSYAEMVAERAFGLGNEEQDPMLICSASAVLCGMGELGVVYLQAGMKQVASLLKHEDHNVVRVACHGLRTLGKRAQPVAGEVKALLKNPKTMALAIVTLEPILGQGQELQKANAVMIGACGRYFAQMSITNDVDAMEVTAIATAPALAPAPATATPATATPATATASVSAPEAQDEIEVDEQVSGIGLFYTFNFRIKLAIYSSV
jgi:hypothetical protein